MDMMESVIGMYLSFIPRLLRWLIVRPIERALSFFSKKPKERLNDKIEKATNSLHQTSILIAEMEEYLEKQKLNAEKLRQEVNISEGIVSMNQKEVEAVKSVFSGELQKENKKSGKWSFFWNIVFWILGLVGGYLISKFLL